MSTIYHLSNKIQTRTRIHKIRKIDQVISSSRISPH